MSLQKRRHSNQRTRKRRTHQKATVAAASVCPNCGGVKRAHHICPACGYYKGSPVISIKVPESPKKG